MTHRYVESRQGKPGDTKLLVLDPLFARGLQVTSLQPGETITVKVTGPNNTEFLPETQATWDIIHQTDSGVQIWAWMVPFTLPPVTTKTFLTVTWKVTLLDASRTFTDKLEVAP
jgi:hypothetical protein